MTTVCPAKTHNDISQNDKYDFLSIAWPAGNKYREKGISNYPAYIRQLTKKYGPLPDTCFFFILTDGPDTGCYPQLCIAYEAAKPKAVTYAEGIQYGCDDWETIPLPPLQIAWNNPYPLFNPLRLYPRPFIRA